MRLRRANGRAVDQCLGKEERDPAGITVGDPMPARELIMLTHVVKKASCVEKVV